MLSHYRWAEIADADLCLLNPFSEDKLHLLASISSLAPGMSVLDLGSGKGELLCQFARDYGITGVGVDDCGPFHRDAVARARALGVDDRVEFVFGDGLDYCRRGGAHEVVACLGAMFMAENFDAMLSTMSTVVRPGGWLWVGEPFWSTEPPGSTTASTQDLMWLLDRFETAGLDLVEMVIASTDDWDRYTASRWLTTGRWLATHPDSPEAADVRERRSRRRREYLASERGRFQWGVFVLQAATSAPEVPR